MKNKILGWVTGVLLIGVLALQFTIPFATVNGLDISAFSTAIKYGNIYWAFNFFWIIVAILVASVSILCIAKIKRQTHGKLYIGLSFLFGAGFMIGIAVLASLQTFIQANPGIGVTDNAGDGILTFFAFFALFFLQMPRYNVYTEQEAEKKLNVGGLEDFLKNNKTVYEDTVLINASYWDTLNRKEPVKLVATEKEFVLGTQPMTVIPFQSISGVKFNRMWSRSIEIDLNDGKIYKILWAPLEKTQPYTVWATGKVYDNIMGVLNKYKK